jgi:hypothetical protein
MNPFTSDIMQFLKHLETAVNTLLTTGLTAWLF